MKGPNHGAENTHGLPADVWAEVGEDFALLMLRMCARCELCFTPTEAEFRNWLHGTLAAATDDDVVNIWDNIMAASREFMHSNVQSPSSVEELPFSESGFIRRWLIEEKVYAPFRVMGTSVCV